MENRLSITVEDTHSGQRIRADIVHVGDHGVFVESSEIFAVDTAVSCLFQDGEKSLTLQGNVTWAITDIKNPTRKTTGRRKRQTTETLFKLGEERAYDIRSMGVLSGGMGIRFKHLSEADTRFLVAIRTGLDRSTKTVRMKLDGVSDEVITQGIPTYNGVELEAQIPFLRIGSSVKFSLGDERVSYKGKVLNVALDGTRESAIPLLRVALGTNAVSEPTGRMYVREEPVASEKSDPEQSVDGVSYGNATPPETAPITTYRPCVTKVEKPTRNNGISYATIALIAAAASAWTTWMFTNNEPVTVNDTKGHSELGVASGRQTRSPSSIKSIRRSRSQKPSTIQTEVAQKKTQQSNTDKPFAFQHDKPQISVHGDRSSVLIPLMGSGQGLREYRLSTPGIAIKLPNAKALIPFNNYGVYRGLIKRVWVRPWESGVQVRVLTAWKKVRHRISFTPNGLEVELTP